MKIEEQYTVQLKFTEVPQGRSSSESLLQVLAYPATAGPLLSGNFQQWQPVLDVLCSAISPSDFNRKAIQRTISAGLTADLIDRTTGRKYLFASEFLTSLRLTPACAIRFDIGLPALPSHAEPVRQKLVTTRSKASPSGSQLRIG